MGEGVREKDVLGRGNYFWEVLEVRKSLVGLRNWKYLRWVGGRD